jgi:arginine/serine-rich splicing factor 4/5/6
MPSGQRVFIGNIPSDCRERDVEKFFKGYGKMGEISIKNGFGFIDFDDYRVPLSLIHLQLF